MRYRTILTAVLAAGVAACGATTTHHVLTGAALPPYAGDVTIVLEGSEAPPHLQEVAIVQAVGSGTQADSRTRRGGAQEGGARARLRHRRARPRRPGRLGGLGLRGGCAHCGPVGVGNAPDADAGAE